jgi:hypothetical protein
MIFIAFIFGLFVLGPLACWVAGMFNPIGYFGEFPWHPAVRAARSQERRNRLK